jgi:hypothetical protein
MFRRAIPYNSFTVGNVFCHNKAPLEGHITQINEAHVVEFDLQMHLVPKLTDHKESRRKPG